MAFSHTLVRTVQSARWVRSALECHMRMCYAATELVRLYQARQLCSRHAGRTARRPYPPCRTAPRWLSMPRAVCRPARTSLPTLLSPLAAKPPTRGRDVATLIVANLRQCAHGRALAHTHEYKWLCEAQRGGCCWLLLC